MKNLVLAFGLVALAPSSFRAEQISLDRVAEIVEKANYTVLGEALKVYQAQESIAEARGELVPSLNLWSLIGIVLEPISVISQDVAPFLVPSNWFRLRQSEILYQAEKEGYRALWANEIYNAKVLYLNILADQALLKMISEFEQILTKNLEVLRKQEKFGAPLGNSIRDLRIKILGLQEDIKRLESLLKEEKRILLFALGMSPSLSVELLDVDLPELKDLELLDSNSLQWRVLDSSPELKQQLHFIEALKYVKKENSFSFLGLASNSRGVAGGIFDELPIASGLGFATAPALKISQLERERFLLQLRGIEETLKKDLYDVVDRYNLEISVSQEISGRLALAQESFDYLKKRILVGEFISASDFSDSLRNLISAANDQRQAQYRFLVFKERLARLTFDGDYRSAISFAGDKSSARSYWDFLKENRARVEATMQKSPREVAPTDQKLLSEYFGKMGFLIDAARQDSVWLKKARKFVQKQGGCQQALPRLDLWKAFVRECSTVPLSCTPKLFSIPDLSLLCAQ